MAGHGRPSKTGERSNILLRIPTEVLDRVEAFKTQLEAERGGFAINRTDLVVRLIDVGLHTLQHARQPALPSPPVPAPSLPPPSPPALPAPQARRKGAVPLEILEVLAGVRRQYPYVPLRVLAQYLFDHGIYKSRTTTGEEGVASNSLIATWLKKAHEAGLLD